MTYKSAWVQPNFQQGPKELNAYYLPYSAGVIWSYAVTDSWVKENFEKVVLSIVIISVMPIIVKLFKQKITK
jgi:hypothetical protein